MGFKGLSMIAFGMPDDMQAARAWHVLPASRPDQPAGVVLLQPAAMPCASAASALQRSGPPSN
jgi:hypothetical protein